MSLRRRSTRVSTSDETGKPVTSGGNAPEASAAPSAGGEARSAAQADSTGGQAATGPVKPPRKRKVPVPPAPGPSGGPSPFSEEELAAAAEGPPGDMELDELDAADIEERGDE